MSVRRLASLLGAILVGVAASLFVLSQLFTRIPTDVRRLGVLLEALQAEDSNPEIVVFGDSVIMSGVDARQLSQAIPEEPLAWNFASTGQILIEAYLLTQELPKSVELSIYGIPVGLGAIPQPLHPHKYNTLFMYGYRPNQNTVSTIEATFDPSVSLLLQRSAISQTFLSRWALRQLIDTQIRVLLRTDLALESARVDLYHPQRYAKPIDPAVTAERIVRQNEAFATDPPIVNKQSTELALRIARDAEIAGRRTLFFLQPVHPDIFARNELAMLAAARDFEETLADIPGTRVIVAMNILDRTQFIDDMHPTNEGAEILTRYLATAISMTK